MRPGPLVTGVLWLLPACSLFGFFETPPQLCEVGDNQVRDCTDEAGFDGQQERFCQHDGLWSYWSDCEVESCAPGLVEYASCEPFFGIPMQMSRVCQDDGSWSDWSHCESVERCADGSDRIRHEGCGPCGLGDYLDNCFEGHWSSSHCINHRYDEDRDGFVNEGCLDFESPDAPECCGELDCDDSCGECSPGGTERPGNDLDEDCDGVASDMDGDGVLAVEEGGDDCLDRDPRRSSGDVDLDGDGYLAAGCGGDDCDDDCPTCYPGAEPRCGDARDHDCDGVVDELTRCGGCVPGEPRVVASMMTSEWTFSVAASGGYAYVGHGGGVTVFDVSTPELPTEAAIVMDVWSTGDIFLRGDSAYLADSTGMAVMDISTPERSELLTPWPRLQISTYRIFVVGPRAYTISAQYSARETIQAFDVSIPERPLPVERFDDDENTIQLNGLFVARGTIFAVGSEILAMDTSDITGWSGTFLPTGSRDEMYFDIVVRDGLAYVVGEGGIFILDVSDPSDMRLVSSFTRMGYWRSLFVAGDFFYATGQQSNIEESRFMSGLHIFDVSNPTELVEVLSVEDVPTQDVFVSGGYAYVVGDEPSGFYVIDLDCGGG